MEAFVPVGGVKEYLGVVPEHAFTGFSSFRVESIGAVLFNAQWSQMCVKPNTTNVVERAHVFKKLLVIELY